MPVAALTVSTIRSGGGIGSIRMTPKLWRRLVGPVAQVRRIIPQPVHADAHARREKIPDVRFPQENPVAVKLVQHRISAGSHEASAGNPGVAITTHFHVYPLKMTAQENRSRRIRRTGQETLGAPYEQVGTANQLSPFFCPRSSALVLTSLAMGHGAQGNGTKVPDDAGGQSDMQTVADCVGASVKQRLAAAVAMILNPITAAAVLLRAIVHVTEPRAHLKGQTLDQETLQLRKRLDAQVSVEIFLVSEAAQTIVTLAEWSHPELETADPSREERPVVPVKDDAIARRARC